MKKLLFLLILLVSCSQNKVQYRTFQVKYIQNQEVKYLLINTKFTKPCRFEVVSQEYFDSIPNITILELVDYNMFTK